MIHQGTHHRPPHVRKLLTCASRLCLRSFSIHRQLPDIELYCHQPLQVLDLIYKNYHGNSPAVV